MNIREIQQELTKTRVEKDANEASSQKFAQNICETDLDLEKLEEALDWAKNNQPKETDLEELERLFYENYKENK